MTTEAEIDSRTGLPKLSIELLPDSEEDRKLWLNSCASRSTDYLHRLPVHPADTATKFPNRCSTTLARELEAPALMDLRHSSSSPECHQRSFSGTAGTGPFVRNAKQRTSLYIKLHRTSTVPQRLSILTENMTGNSDTGIHTAPVVTSVPDSQFSFPPEGEHHHHHPPSRQFASTPDLPLKDSPDGSTTPPLPATSPAAKRLASTGRRNSFLYETDGNSAVPSYTHASSIANHMEETFVTPFAQILATMHKVRQNFILLMGLPEGGHRHTTTTSFTPQPYTKRPPLSPANRKHSLDTSRQQHAVATLEQIDWCLHQLECVDSAKAMGGPLAQDKFHRLLTKELSNMSVRSKSGNKLAEWVHDITGSTNERNLQVDRALSQEKAGYGSSSEEMHMQPHLSSSMSHDVWRKKAILRSNTGTQIHIRLQDDCERVPTFGVTDTKMNVTEMRQFMEEEVGQWSPDVFRLDEISAGNSLVCVAYNIFKTRKLSPAFKVSPPTFINFILAIQNRYHNANPYHNQIHAADVLLTADFLLRAKPLENVFSKLEVFAALVAAAIHDVDHPGRSNQFLIETSDHLAILYNDNSVLENHHLAVAFKAMAEPGCDFLEHLDKEQTKAFRRVVIDMVLATDMSVHFKHLAELKTLLETRTLTNDGILEVDTYQERSELLQCLVHCADLSNPAKKENLAVNWSNRIMQETFQQGDEERKRGIPLNPLGDREQVSIAKCQVTFIDLIVYPLFETWSELVYPEAQHILDNLSSTRLYWMSHVTNSPPPTLPGSPTPPAVTPTSPESPTTPSTLTYTAGNTPSYSGFAKVEENCNVKEDEPLQFSTPSSDRKLSVNKSSPARERRNSFKSTRVKSIDEDR